MSDTYFTQIPDPSTRNLYLPVEVNHTPAARKYDEGGLCPHGVTHHFPNPERDTYYCEKETYHNGSHLHTKATSLYPDGYTWSTQDHPDTGRVACILCDGDMEHNGYLKEN